MAPGAISRSPRRHPGALAVDVMRLGKTVDGKRVWLDVQRDFNGEIGAETCGPRAKPPAPATEGALELRAIFCQAAAQRLFTSMSSPNYNQPHFNHFHLEITPDVKWQLAR